MSAPQTPFEASGREVFTSRDEGESFLAKVAEETAAVLREEGRSYEGRIILSLTLGTGPSTLLATGSVHGEELAGRDMLYIKLRDLAYSEDSAVFAFLASHRIVFVPTVNIDRVLQTRDNAQGININRDMYDLSTPEALVAHRLMTRYDPDVVGDFHERGGTTSYDYEPAAFSFDDPNCDRHIASLSKDLENYLIDESQYNARMYPAGRPRAGISTMAGMRCIIEVITETWRQHDPDFRTEVQEDGWDNLINWWTARSSWLGSVRRAARARLALAGRTRAGFVMLSGSDFYNDITETPIDTPSGYQLSDTKALNKWRDLGVVTDPGGYVSMDQSTSNLIPTLLEQDATYEAAEAERVERAHSINHFDGTSWIPTKVR